MNHYGEKAGMQGIDKEKISKIIEESTGEKYQAFSQKQQQRIEARNREIKTRIAAITENEKARLLREVDDMARVLEESRCLSRHCVHIDMDAFFAAVEMRDLPELRSVPMAVGGMSMLSTSNYLARRFGVRAAMPGFIALKLCPQLRIVPGNYDKYRKESKIFSEIFMEYDPDLSMGSLDEAYIDLTDYMESRETERTITRRRFTGGCQCRYPYVPIETLRQDGLQESEPEPDIVMDQPSTSRSSPSASPRLTQKEACDRCKMERITVEDEVTFGTSRAEVVREIRFRVEQKTGLTCSAGIAANFMLAKICSDLNKPNGQYELPNEREKIIEFLKDLPIRKVSGIGRVSEAHLHAAGIHTTGEMWSRRWVLPAIFSNLAVEGFLRTAMGLSHRPSSGDPRRKSISVETTFAPSAETALLMNTIKELCAELASQLKQSHISGGRNVAIKVKLSTFDVLTRATTVDSLVYTADDLFRHAAALLQKELGPEVRLLGVRLSKLVFDYDEDHRAKKRTISDFLQPQPKLPKLSKQETQGISVAPSCSTSEDNGADEISVMSMPSTSSKTIAGFIDPVLLDDSPSVDASGLGSHSEVQCPVCQCILNDDDRLINKHIDECLNGDVIRGDGEVDQVDRGRDQPNNLASTIDHEVVKENIPSWMKVEAVKVAGERKGKRIRTIDAFFKKK